MAARNGAACCASSIRRPPAPLAFYAYGIGAARRAVAVAHSQTLPAAMGPPICPEVAVANSLDGVIAYRHIGGKRDARPMTSTAFKVDHYSQQEPSALLPAALGA